MNSETYEGVRGFLHNLADKIATGKRPGYTQGTADVLSNFKKVGELVPVECPECGHGFHLSQGQAWAVYYLKHVLAGVSGVCRPNLPQAEPLAGRFADQINYSDLGFGIAVEQEELRLLQEEFARQEQAKTVTTVTATDPLPWKQKELPVVAEDSSETKILSFKYRESKEDINLPPGA